jgi:hypothetical protein
MDLGGGWKLIQVSFYGENSWAVALRQIKSGSVKHHGITTSFIWIIILFEKAFEYGNCVNFEVMLRQRTTL